MDPTTSIIQGVSSTSNNAGSLQERSDRIHTYSDSGVTGHPIALDGVDQKHNRDPSKRVNILNTNLEVKEPKLMHSFSGKTSDFTCSQAGTWADEALARRELKIANSKDHDPLNVAKNITEEGKLVAGKKHGIRENRAFDDAWADATHNA